MKPSKYWQFGELAKTMETIEQFTDNEFHFQKTELGNKEFDNEEFNDNDDEKFNDKEKAQTINTSGFKRFLGLKSTWLIKYTDEKYAPHEMLLKLAINEIDNIEPKIGFHFFTVLRTQNSIRGQVPEHASVTPIHS